MLLLLSASLVFFFIHNKTQHEGGRKGAGGVPEAEEVLKLEYLPFFATVSKKNGSSPQPSCQRISSIAHTQHTETGFQILPETLPVLLQLFMHLHT